MKPKRPLPQERPFITFVTNTFRRPQGLAACMASVCRQTAVAHIEQIVLPDHLGHSPADAVYGRMPWYATAARGEYVHVLGDDDELASEKVVAQLMAFARKEHEPPVIVVRAQKGPDEFPKCGLRGEPKEGDVDLVNYVMRRDVFVGHACSYGRNYKCDWDGYLALKERAGGRLEPCDLLFAVGKASGGRPEVDW